MKTSFMVSPKNRKMVNRYVYHYGRKVVDGIKKACGYKPHLQYFEFHLADHCNLNCKGCSHFSPIAEHHFPDLAEYENDLKQLQKLFSSVQSIRLMGGEPFLNPQIENFLLTTRSHFPKAVITVVTNGLLVPQMPETFWETCRVCSVGISITIYPPVKEKALSLIQFIKGNGVNVFTDSADIFLAFYNKKGDTDANQAFKKCRSRWYSPFLKEGKLYVCPKPATIHSFNKLYNLDIPQTGVVDIYEPGITGWNVRSQLDTAPSICRYCALGWGKVPAFNWSTSNRTLEDWVAT